MTPHDIVMNLLTDNLGRKSSQVIDPSTHLRRDLRLDPIDWLELALTLEFHGIDAPDDELRALETIADLQALVRRHIH